MPAGRLEVITGCMFSGKTEELIRRLERVHIALGSFLLFKPTIDNRYGSDIVATHYGRKLVAIPLRPSEETVLRIIEMVGIRAMESCSVVAFDEGNFFTDEFPRLCEDLVNMGKRVIVAGLDLTFAGKPFGPMPELMALSDQVDKLTAVCVNCGRTATRTQRLVNGQPAPTDGPTIQIGGADTYEARCRECYEGG